MADEGEATQPAQQDVKPDVKGEGEHLNLKVKAQVDLLLQLSLPLTLVNAESSDFAGTATSDCHVARSHEASASYALVQSHIPSSCRASYSPR